MIVALGVPVKLRVAEAPLQTDVAVLEKEAAGKAFTTTVTELLRVVMHVFKSGDPTLTSVYIAFEVNADAGSAAVPDAFRVIVWFPLLPTV